jgi:hypothetical protein
MRQVDSHHGDTTSHHDGSYSIRLYGTRGIHGISIKNSIGTDNMTKPHRATPERLSALSNGIFAILITVLVLELRPPEYPTLSALLLLWPTWLSYAVSFLLPLSGPITIISCAMPRWRALGCCGSILRICFPCRYFHSLPLGWALANWHHNRFPSMQRFSSLLTQHTYV